ncbi:GTPase ObgE [Candidatus Berkelbacteria bacterium]|nr:GTPase ObgE [Candidatus Berkelbacteria bacterium]
MFIDEAEIKIEAGRGGDGVASFRREKFVPKGGPDGGDGGIGGSVYFRVRENIHGLAAHTATRFYRAKNGEAGRPKRQSGKSGANLTIDLPPGTQIYELDSKNQAKFVVDLVSSSASLFCIARGGRGGLGNVHFATATHQTPREFTLGQAGEKKHLRLIVHHLADVGLIGLPNAGKSTLLARLSQARPKIANYPFTTLEPHLGVAEFDKTRFVMADIPGLIAGSAVGKGLGHKFLRHLSRTKILVHLISLQNADPDRAYAQIRTELKNFNPDLIAKPEIVVLSQADTLPKTEQLKRKIKINSFHPIVLSSVSGQGLNELQSRIAKLLNLIRT